MQSRDTGEPPKGSSHVTNDHMTSVLLQSVDVPYKEEQTENIVIREKLQKITLEDYSTDSDDENSDHVTGDHVTSDHVTSDHVTGDHVTSDHVTDTSRDKLYKAMDHWYTSRTREWLIQYHSNNVEMIQTNLITDGSEGGEEGERRKGNDAEGIVYLPPVHGIETNKIQKDVFLRQLKTK